MDRIGVAVRRYGRPRYMEKPEASRSASEAMFV